MPETTLHWQTTAGGGVLVHWRRRDEEGWIAAPTIFAALLILLDRFEPQEPPCASVSTD